MDERERSLERDAALGDQDAEAQRLVARLRAGELRPVHLELLAHLGHLPACRALGKPAPEAPAEPWSWVGQLSRWGIAVAGRACLGVLRPVLEGYDAERPNDPSARDLASAAEAWCDCPCDLHRDAVVGAFQSTPAFQAIVGMTLGPFQFFGAAGQLLSGAEGERLEGFRRALEEATGQDVGDPIERIRAELITWVLTGPASVEEPGAPPPEA